ncbi:MAG TPA: trypsin-like serine protease, partial [Candidatus Izemoplasmatales bacterium]|nr:trypsin-like serine protease [Candidatus Izemoplasmatales bacterium]
PVIQHSATIDNGSSGGALVDVDGILVGINTWGSETDPLKSFAIPIYLVYVFLYNNGFCQP